MEGVFGYGQEMQFVARRRLNGGTVQKVWHFPEDRPLPDRPSVHDDIWLVSFMDYDLGYFDLETRVLEPLENPFGPKVSPM